MSDITPFSGILPGYMQAQNLQMQRQAQFDAQDQTEQEQQRYANQQMFQQGQADAGAKQQQWQNQFDQAKFDQLVEENKQQRQDEKDKSKATSDAAAAKARAQSDAVSIKDFDVALKQYIAGGGTDGFGFSHAWHALHNSEHPNVLIYPGQDPNAPHGLPTAPQMQAPSVMSAPQQLGGGTSPLQTPQIAAPPSTNANLFDTLRNAQAGAQGGQIPVAPMIAARQGLIGAQTATEQQRPGLIEAQTGAANANANLANSRALTVDQMRQPQIANILSQTQTRNDHEVWAKKVAQQNADTHQASQRSQAIYRDNLLAWRKSVQQHKNDIEGTWRDPVMQRALGQSQQIVAGLLPRQKALTDALAQIDTRQTTIASMMASSDPGPKHPAEHQLWATYNQTLPALVNTQGVVVAPAQKAGERMIADWAKQKVGLADQLNNANTMMATHQKFISAAGLRLNDDGSLMAGGKQIAPPDEVPDLIGEAPQGMGDVRQQLDNKVTLPGSGMVPPKNPTAGQKWTNSDGVNFLWNGKAWINPNQSAPPAGSKQVTIPKRTTPPPKKQTGKVPVFDPTTGSFK